MIRVRLIDDAAKSDAKITAVYVRVTREESLKLDLSIPNQKNRAIELCGERGWGIVKIYQEPRQVGGDLLPRKRPALAALLSDVEAGRVERVLVRHTDRLWRSTEVEELILRALHQHSVELWDFHGPRELRSAGGRFALKVLGAAAELEKGLTAERIREMKRGKALAGKTGGGPPPFGYTFFIRGSVDHWKFALVGPKNRFREAYVTGRLKIEGNAIEFSRIGKAVHGLSEVLRDMAQANPAVLEPA